MLDLTEYPAQVVEIHHLTSDVIELVVELQPDQSFAFKAGQYIQFVFDYTFRSYSMINAPGSAGSPVRLSFCIKLIDDGIGSEYLGGLKVGDSIQLRGPYGDFILKDKAKDVLCIATSTGIAPILSILRDGLSRDSTQKFTLLFGLRHEADIFYHAELKSLADQYQNLNFVPLLSQPVAGWVGTRGRVTHYLLDNPAVSQGKLAYLCGSQAMVTDCRDILLKQGVDGKNIFQEIFS